MARPKKEDFKEERKSLLEGDQADCSGDPEGALMVREDYRRVLAAAEELEKAVQAAGISELQEWSCLPIEVLVFQD
jgi:hypothetical protein